MRALLVLLVVVSAGLAYGSSSQNGDLYKNAFYIAPMTNVPIIGSQDERVGLYMGYRRMDPRHNARFFGTRFRLGFEAALSFTYGGGWRDEPRDTAWAISIMQVYRYESLGARGLGSYWEFGGGLHFASRTTKDLDSPLSSTPLGGGGVILRSGDRFYECGLRWYHISNAGFVGDNQGQNQLWLLMGIRF